MIYFYFDVAINPIWVLVATLMIIGIFLILYFGNQEEVPYNRNIPDLPIAVINYYATGKITDKTIWLTLLELISKGYYQLYRKDNEYYLKWNRGKLLELDNIGLNKMERILVGLINGIILENKQNEISIDLLHKAMKSRINLSHTFRHFYNALKSYIRESHGYFNYYQNYVIAVLIDIGYFFIIFQSYKLGVLLLIFFFTALIILTSSALKNFRFDFKSIVGVITLIYSIFAISMPFIPTILFNNNSWLFILLLMNPILFMTNIYLLNLEFPMPHQKEIMTNIKGLKHFLEDFSNLKDRDIDYINFFDKYYAVSEALDVKLTDNPYLRDIYDDNTFETITPMELSEAIIDLFNK